MKTRNISFNIMTIIIPIFAIRAVVGVFLAFDSVDYNMPLYTALISLTNYVAMLLGLYYIFKKGNFSYSKLYLLLPPILYWLFLILHTYGGYGSGSDTWIITLITVCSFMLMDNVSKAKIFDVFYWIIQINNIISLLIFFCYGMGINIGFQQVPFYRDNAVALGQYYQKWGIFAIYSGAKMDRICGIFNEPGALGTVCALLFIARFNKSKLWEKILLLVIIFFTYSFAGYLLVFLFLAFYLIRKNWRNFIFIILFVAAFIAIPQIDWHNDAINAVASRFSITESGITGDNRTSQEFDQKFDEFMQSSDMFIGKGAGYTLTSHDGSSYTRYIVQFGVIGFILLIGVWLITALRASERDPDGLLLIIFFFISLYQRPNLTNMFGYVMLFGGLAWINMNNGSQTDASLIERDEEDTNIRAH